MKFSLVFLVSVVAISSLTAQDRWENLLPKIEHSPLREFHENWYSYVATTLKTFVGQSMTVDARKDGGHDVIVTEQGKNSIRLELFPDGTFDRLKTTYGDAETVQNFQADTLVLEYQQKEKALLYQRIRSGKIEETKVQPWGPGWIDFSSLPFLVERLLATGYRGTFVFQTAGQDKSGEMTVNVVKTNKPLDRNRLYAFPRAMRDRYGAFPGLLVELSASTELKTSYPFSFYYLYSDELRPRLLATWGGPPSAPGFHWSVP